MFCHFITTKKSNTEAYLPPTGTLIIKSIGLVKPVTQEYSCRYNVQLGKMTYLNITGEENWKHEGCVYIRSEPWSKRL